MEQVSAVTQIYRRCTIQDTIMFLLSVNHIDFYLPKAKFAQMQKTEFFRKLLKPKVLTFSQ